MQLFYRLFYSTPINLLVRNLLFPFRKYLPKQLMIPVSGIISIQSEKGEIKFYANETDSMSKKLFWEDEGCSFEFSLIFKKIIPSCATFFDIGANVGYYSLLAKKLNSDIKIHSFEPSIGAKYFLKKNCSINHFDDITRVDKALGNYTGTIEFYEEKNPKFLYLEHHGGGIGNTANTWEIDNSLKYNVDVIRLDDYCKEAHVTTIDLIKIDTEGTEDLVFSGGKESILRSNPIIICEVLSGRIESKIQDIITKEFGFDIFQFQTKTNKLKPVSNLSEAVKNGETNYFFIPKAKQHLVAEFIEK